MQPDNAAEISRRGDAYCDDRSIGLMDLLIILAKRKVLIFGITFVVAIAAIIIALILPNIYTATAKILPPQQNQATSALLGQLSALAGAGATGALGFKNPNELYVGMLKSRTVADSLIERFKLKQVFGHEKMVDTRTALESATNITVAKEGLISIECSHTDPKLAASLANGYVEELYKLTRTFAISEASQRRLFFEKQLQQTKDALVTAEVAMRRSQEATGVIKLDEQGKAIIESIAKLRAQIAAKEVQLSALRTFATDRNPDYILARQELTELRVQLGKLERDESHATGDVLLPSGKVPAIGLEHVRRFRDVKYQETMFELLARQYELAKIDEAKEASLIQVLDPAIEPEKKSKPNKRLIVMLATTLAFLAAVLLAFLLELAERARQDSRFVENMSTLRRYLYWRAR
jgi:tyrosine-protein kinase Etk/Wzc